VQGFATEVQQSRFVGDGAIFSSESNVRTDPALTVLQRGGALCFFSIWLSSSQRSTWSNQLVWSVEYDIALEPLASALR
jgi:hypothetical protein